LAYLRDFRKLQKSGAAWDTRQTVQRRKKKDKNNNEKKRGNKASEVVKNDT
jgi:hypothetical protein